LVSLPVLTKFPSFEFPKPYLFYLFLLMHLKASYQIILLTMNANII
jgi:hypothetical protein